MREQKRKGNRGASVVAAVLLMALAVGVLVLLAVGLLLSCVVLKGGAGLGVLYAGALAALFLAALAGGSFACVRLKSMPLVWSVCVAAGLSLLCLAAGFLTYGSADAGVAVQRVCAAMAGGVAAGILSALIRK